VAKVYEKKKVDVVVNGAVVGLFGLFDGVPEIASEWANQAVTNLARVFGGHAVNIFRNLGVWRFGLRTYISLRLANVVSGAHCKEVNEALSNGLKQEGTLQILAAMQFLGDAVASIRSEVGSGPRAVARTILSELAEEYEVHKMLRRAAQPRQPRSRAVDMVPPLKFSRNFGAASNIADRTLLHVVIVGPDGRRIASVVSNADLYGSEPISMSTAAVEAQRLLDVGRLTNKALSEVGPDETVYMSMTAAYAGALTNKIVRFGTTKHGQRRGVPPVECIRFKMRDLSKVLAVRKYERCLFSPHYDVSGKGQPLAVLKITLSFGAFRSSESICGLLRTMDNGADGKKKRKRGS
jgi:hypothetical protein